MKKIILAVLVLISMDAAAQIRLHANTNYIFDDRIDSRFDANNFYIGKIRGGFQWGGALEYMVRPEYGIEVSYFRQDAVAPLKTSKYPFENHDFDIAINYIFLSGSRYVRKPGGKVEGFGGLGLGAAIIDAKDPATGQSTNTTKFAWQLRGGAIVWGSEKIGIKLQAQLQSAVQAVGGGLFFGTGGASAGVSTFSSILQFGLGGGLVFNLNGPDKK